MPSTGTRDTLGERTADTKETALSTTATATRDAPPSDAGYKYDAAIDRSQKRPFENEHESLPYPGEGASEIADVAETSTSGRSVRAALTIDQREALQRSLEDLAALEADRAERIVAVGLEPVVAYEIGIRSAVHDALAKLANGIYGECETCARPIPVGRLEAVPYARRCLPCQEREENGWNRVERVVGGVVRVLAGEPQGRSEAEL
jgi:hypothetical protein